MRGENAEAQRPHRTLRDQEDQKARSKTDQSLQLIYLPCLDFMGIRKVPRKISICWN